MARDNSRFDRQVTDSMMPEGVEHLIWLACIAFALL